jgi:hypothetical protein
MIRTLTLLVLSILPSSSLARDTVSTLESQRLRQGAFFGAQVITGQLSFRSNTAESDIQLTAMPALTIGGDLWPSEDLGLFGALSIGTGAQIKDVLGNTVDYNLMLSRFGVRYRWYAGPRSDSLAGGLGVGGRISYQFVQEQRPAVLIDRTIVGPEAHTYLTVPLSEGIWLRASAHLGLPFFVREGPADTGDPKGFFNVGGRMSAVMAVTGPWGIQVSGDYDYRFINFKGIGTRAAGITQGKTTDAFGTLLVGVRYISLSE